MPAWYGLAMHITARRRGAGGKVEAEPADLVVQRRVFDRDEVEARGLTSVALAGSLEVVEFTANADLRGIERCSPPTRQSQNAAIKIVATNFTRSIVFIKR